MREIVVEVDKDGRVKVLYRGFAGRECFEEAERLYRLLSAQGLEVAIEHVALTQEYYTRAPRGRRWWAVARGEVSALVSARSVLILFFARDQLEELLRRLRELGLEFEEEVVVPCG